MSTVHGLSGTLQSEPRVGVTGEACFYATLKYMISLPFQFKP